VRHQPGGADVQASVRSSHHDFTTLHYLPTPRLKLFIFEAPNSAMYDRKYDAGYPTFTLRLAVFDLIWMAVLYILA
jgi:hypothetical protein